MGELFTSFDDAWSHLLRRDEPLENFYDQFPEDEAFVFAGWVIEPTAGIKAAAAEIQAELAHLDWIVPVPDHFLHVWVGAEGHIDDAWRSWSGIGAFSVVYRQVNCLHTAVVVEVDGPVRRLLEGTVDDVPTFLPHMTVAIVQAAGPAAELREALIPLRDADLGAQDVQEVTRVRFPAARSTLLRPWTVENVVQLA